MSRFTLSPRAALLLVGVVVVLALGVVVAGWWGGGRGDGTDGPGVSVVTGASTAGAAESAAAAAASASGSAPASVPAGPSSGSASPAAAVLYVVGAVEHAGVVSVAADARVADALAAAGGAAADADLSRLNLARPVVDGERLYVPRVGEDEVPAELPAGGGGGGGSGRGAVPGAGGSASGPTGSSGSGGGAGAAPELVDLNAADATALESLPGIGPALAERIIAWRDEHGGFRSVEDLLEVSGIGEGRFADLQDRVTV